MNAQGKVEIQVHTNVNKFICACDETSFISEVDDASIKILKLPVKALKCPSKGMDKDLRTLFEANQYPYIILYLDEVELGAIVQNNKDVKITIIVKQTKNKYDFEISTIEKKGEIYLKGEETVSLLDFNIEPPTKAFGMIKVRDTVSISFLIPTEILSK